MGLITARGIWERGDGQWADLPSCAFLACYGREAGECTGGKGRNSGLHADFDGFEGAESDVGDELGGGAGGKVKGRFVFVGSFLTGEVGVEFLEEFVAAVFERSLCLTLP